MPELSRREFLSSSAVVAAALGFGALAPVEGKRLGTVPFVEEGGSPIGTLIAGSHQGRLVYDLERVDEGRLVTPNEAFFIRTRYPDGLTPEHPWRIQVRGHVRRERGLTLDELLRDVEPMGAQLLECSGNSRFRKFGLLSSAEWSGIPIVKVIERAHPTPRATRLLVSGHDEHSDFRTARGRGASWIFGFDELERAGAYLATEMNGETLPKDHGAPVRLIMPNWYGCTCIKWVQSLELVDDDAPSTAQMREFAGRTHQDGVPKLAREFAPASMDQAGMVTRVEKWHDGGIFYRLLGILWGGERLTDSFRIRFGDARSEEPLEHYDHRDNHTWTLWTHRWRPSKPGRYVISLRVADPTIRTRRLDRGYYARQVDIAEV